MTPRRIVLGGGVSALLAVAACLLLATPAAHAQAPPAGMMPMTHTSPTGVYQVFVPASYGVADSFEMDQPSPVGNVHGTGYQVASDFLMPNMMALQHFSAPPGFEQGRTDEQVVWDTLVGLVGGIGGTVIEQRPITLGPYTGLEGDFVATFEGMTMAGRVRVFKLGNEAVGVFYVGLSSPTVSNESIISHPTGVAFLESLTFVPVAAP